MLITIGEVRESPAYGGSDGTTVNVFEQFGHMKQFRAHLGRTIDASSWRPLNSLTYDSPVLLCSHTCTGHLKEAVWAVVPAHFDEHTSIAAYRVAFFAEVKVVEGVKAMR